MTEMYSFICKGCGERYTVPKTKGRPPISCISPACKKAASAASKKESANKSKKKSEELYEAANAKFSALSYPEQQEFFALLYEEIKRDCKEINVDFRRAMTSQTINAFYRADKTIVPTLAQKFYSFCVDQRGVTPMEIFKKGKSQQEINFIAEREQTNTVTHTNDYGTKEKPAPYDSAAFCAENTIGGKIEYLIGDCDAFKQALMAQELKKAAKVDAPKATPTRAPVAPAPKPKQRTYDDFLAEQEIENRRIANENLRNAGYEETTPARKIPSLLDSDWG